jgi:hypothetical protein
VSAAAAGWLLLPLKLGCLLAPALRCAAPSSNPPLRSKFVCVLPEGDISLIVFPVALRFFFFLNHACTFCSHKN